jgi:superfamily I DNA/RNA helicase
VRPTYEYLRQRHPNVRLAGSDPPELSLLEGYRLLARDTRSRLGWSIVLEIEGPDRLDELLREVLDHEHELADYVPAHLQERHLPLVEIVRQLLDGEEVAGEDEAALQAAIDLQIELIKTTLQRDDEVPDVEEPPDPDSPKIVCSTMVSAKGLSAEHVFIVGFVDGQFPSHPEDITDHEVCCLLVALSRTRKQCHVVSCGRWKGDRVRVSSFLRWLDVPIERRARNADYWKANPD